MVYEPWRHHPGLASHVARGLLERGEANGCVARRRIEQHPQGRRLGYVSRLEDFYNAVVAQGEKHPRGNKNAFAFATLFYPPILRWFEKNGIFPKQNYTNHLQMMTDLNGRVMELNQRILTEQRDIYIEENDGMISGEISRAPKFHTFGVRDRKHRMEWFRERNASKKLHLTDRHRSTLGRAAGTYFKKMFEPAFA